MVVLQDDSYRKEEIRHRHLSPTKKGWRDEILTRTLSGLVSHLREDDSG